MFKDFKLFKTIGTTFGDAFDLFQTGAQIYSAFTEKEEESRGFVPKKKFNFDSSIPTPRAQLRTMEAPVGLRNPNIQTAYRFFADNVAKDKNIQKLVATNYRAGRTSKQVSTRENIEVGSYGTANTGSARASRVSRTTFRSRL